MDCIKYNSTVSRRLASKIGDSYIDELLADPTPACHKVAVPPGVVGPGIKSRTALPTKAVPHCEISRIWLESDWNEAATTSYSSGVTPTFDRHLKPTRRDPCLGHVLMRSRSPNKTWVLRSTVLLMKKVCVSTPLVVISLEWSFYFVGFQNKITKAPPRCIKLHLRLLSLQPVRWYFLL